jgi:hypothetical protein
VFRPITFYTNKLLVRLHPPGQSSAWISCRWLFMCGANLQLIAPFFESGKPLPPDPSLKLMAGCGRLGGLGALLAVVVAVAVAAVLQ